jgi:hypothetical protein
VAKTYKNPGPLKFKAVIQAVQTRNNLALYVDFPYDLKETFGVGNLVPYKVTFDGRVHYQGSLAKMGGPNAMILLRKDVQAELGKGAGEPVEVVVELDDRPRKIEVATDIKKALQAAGLWEKFEKLAYTHRKEYVVWIEDAKKPETRQNRIEKMCDLLK